MKTIQKKRSSLTKVVVASLAWGLIITGCSDSEKKSNAKPSFKVEAVTESAWLYGSLPENTVAYARLPNPWSGFSAKEDSFKYALGNQEHVKAIKQIQQGVYDNILSNLQEPAKPLAQFYLEHTKGPMEIAFVSQNGQPVVFAGTSLDYTDDTSFNEAFSGLINGIPNATLMTQAEKTEGVVSFGPGVAVYYSYNTSNQRFTLVSSTGASVTSLEKAAATIKSNDTHELLKLESDIDSSHQGFFVWASPKNALPFMQMGMQPQQLAKLKELGIDQAEGVALGYGVSNGKTRFKLLLDMPNIGVRRFVPTFNHDIDIKTVGEPRSVAVIGWPSKKQFDTIIGHFEEFSPGINEQFVDLSELLESEVGLTLDDIFMLDGSNIIRVNDDVGVYWVWKHNPEKWKKLIKGYQEHLNTQYEVVERSGLRIHHLTIPNIQDDMKEGLQGVNNPVIDIFSRTSQHMYWVEENGHMVYSSVPQVLIERAERGTDTELEAWVTDTQGTDLSSSLLAYTTTVDDLSRTSYHYYLELMILLNDIAGSDVDILSLPTSEQLGFADKGTIGFSVNSSEEYLGLEFTFENGATDVMVGAGGVATVAVVGILAAVAVPAYQDYTVRAEMSSGLYAAESVKLQIAEALVIGAEIEDLDNGFESIQAAEDYENSVIEKIVVNDGVITMFFKNKRLGYGPQTLVYVPMFDGDRITYWDCTGGTVEEKFRPARCR